MSKQILVLFAAINLLAVTGAMAAQNDPKCPGGGSDGVGNVTVAKGDGNATTNPQTPPVATGAH